MEQSLNVTFVKRNKIYMHYNLYRTKFKISKFICLEVYKNKIYNNKIYIWCKIKYYSPLVGPG